MNFSELPPSKQWAPLRYQGKSFAEVWFKPEGQPDVLQFRIPQESFQVPGLGPLLTIENLLNAIAIPSEELESWYLGNDPEAGANVAHDGLQLPLSPPPQDASHLHIVLRMMQPAPEEKTVPESASAKWLFLQTRWNFVLGLEVTIDTTRQRMESLRSEMDAAIHKVLAGDEKVYAANADLAQWNKTKSRARFALPRVKEFIHRATWALGTPERKKLEELFKDQHQPELDLLELDQLLTEIEHILKDRQILSAQGTTIYQECKSSLSDIQAAMRLLQSNAQRKKVASRAKTR